MYGSDISEKKATRYTKKDDLYNALYRIFRGIKIRISGELDGDLVGNMLVRDVIITHQENKDDMKLQIGIATIEDRVSSGVDTYVINGLAYNNYLKKIGNVSISFQRTSESSHNTTIDYPPASDDVAHKFKDILSRLGLAGDEYTFINRLTASFSNISFGVLEEAGTKPHRMIYCDKVPIGVHIFGDYYRGLYLDKKDNKVKNATVQFKTKNANVMVKYVGAEEVSASMFDVFGNLVNYDSPDDSNPMITAFGSSKSKTVTLKAKDMPEAKNLRIPLGVGLESHLKHLHRSHKKYSGLAYNVFAQKVGKMTVTTERLYRDQSAHYDFKSRVEYMPDDDKLREKFRKAVDRLPTKVTRFMKERICDWFMNPSLGPERHRGQYTILRAVYSDGIEIGSYLENTNTGERNYRGLYWDKGTIGQSVYVNTVHVLKTRI